MKYVVFGAGMQGRVIAADLAKEGSEVSLADLQLPKAALPPGVTATRADAMDASSVRDAVRGADAVVLALPGEIARRALANLISVGAPVVDVSFTPQPPLDLDKAAKASGASVILDCGIAPGLSHLLAAAARRDLEGLDGLHIRVGGLPADPPVHFRHAVYFNPRDLVAEYLRPARARYAGKDVAPHPLDAAFERYDDPELGPLDAFLSDGLRSLLSSYRDVRDMTERTLRWPGHLDFMTALRAAGLIEEKALPGAPEPTADTTARALAASYPAEQYPDILIMTVEALNGGKRRAWRLQDVRSGGVTAMGRTTGFTTAAIARLVAKGRFRLPGVHAPERLGDEKGLVSEVLADLAERGVRVEIVT